MKKIIQLTVVAILFACNTTFAQDNGMAKMTPEQRSERRIERLNADLQLTDAQKPQLKDLFMKQESMRDKSMDEQKEFRKSFELRFL